MKSNGFASIYALLLLELVVAFCITLIIAITTFTASDPQAPLFEAEIYAIYHIKARINEASEQTPPQDMTPESNEETDEIKDSYFAVTSEILNYEGIMIKIQYEEDTVDVFYQNVHLRIRCDLIHKRITDLVYLSQ